MKTWTFYWLDGRRDVLTAETPEAALNQAGYGRGALAALDFYGEGDQDEHVWDAVARTWNKTTEDRGNE